MPKWSNKLSVRTEPARPNTTGSKKTVLLGMERLPVQER